MPESDGDPASVAMAIIARPGCVRIDLEDLWHHPIATYRRSTTI
jgi:hypothetical protein